MLGAAQYWQHCLDSIITLQTQRLHLVVARVRGLFPLFPVQGPINPMLQQSDPLCGSGTTQSRFVHFPSLPRLSFHRKIGLQLFIRGGGGNFDTCATTQNSYCIEPMSITVNSASGRRIDNYNSWRSMHREPPVSISPGRGYR